MAYNNAMQRAKTKKLTAEQIARRADKGEDVSRHFTNRGRMMPATRVRSSRVRPKAKQATHRLADQNASALLVELEAARRNANISVAALAQQTGLTVHTIRDALNPSSDPLVSVVLQIAGVFGLTLKLIRRKPNS